MNKNQIAKSKVVVLLSGLFAAAIPALVQAANQPDAGTILDTVRSKDFAPPKKSDPGINIQQESQPATKHASSFKTKVTAFHITGATVFTEAQLKSRIASLIGQELSLDDLEKAAAVISRFYRSNGYFVARAYLPAQEIKDGVVEIAVIEGRIGNIGIKLKADDGKLAESAIKRVIDGSVKHGDVINEAHLERGLLLANDLAGVSVDSTLVPGASVGTSDLVIEARQTGSVSGGVDYDNFGNKFTGTSRVGASVNFNTSYGHQFSLRVMTSGSGLRYGRASYLLPLGAAGTKVGVAYSSMNYKLSGVFSSVDGEGKAEIASVYLIHPFIRSRNYNLYGQLGYDGKHMVDKAGGATSDDKHNDVFMAGVSGDSRDGLGGGGINSYSATVSNGRLDLSSSPNAGADASGPQTNHGFTKTNYSISRVQRLTDDISFYAAFSGQFTSKNLDSSEKFVLGGAAGVRAYPQGEATGDVGELLNVELRRDLGGYAYGNLQLVGFYDVGNIQLNRNPWAGWQGTNSSLRNNYSLSGAGLGINLSKAEAGDNLGGYSVKAYLASKIGSNPGADALGNNSDGSKSSARFWLQATKWF